MTLTEFATARLDEDEEWLRTLTAAAKRSAAKATPKDMADVMGMVMTVVADPEAQAMYERWADGPCYPPSSAERVLREIEAKRRIVDDYRISVSACRNVTGSALDSPGYKSMRGGRDALRAACVAHAAVYSDHPDYAQALKS